MQQRGLALIMTIIWLPVLAAGLVWLASGVDLVRRFDGHTEADRVAYSASAQLATELNTLAVLNRKVLASHLMIGHLITYLSFTRYLKDLIDTASYLLPFGHQIIAGGTTLLVETAKLQLQAGVVVSLAMQHKWAFDSAEILLKGGSRVMQAAEDASGAWVLDALCVSRLCGRAAMDTLIHQAMPVLSGNPARYAELSLQAMRGLPQADWHLSRDWQSRVLWLFEIRRRGTTRSDFTGRGWRATDRLEIEEPSFFGSDWHTLADGRASTFFDGFFYQGLPWLTEWRGLELMPLRVRMTHANAGQLSAESRVRFMGPRGADLWRPIWRAELTGATDA